MGALPKKKITRARRGRRLSSYRLARVNKIICSRCQKYMLPHVVCQHCGYYRGRQVIDL
ncbi:MAG: 50S ribosomal protein L32 [Dehalococcoidia bacterium]|nr:50S ribosomal protein L32 [Dehalococcoidia bacterium]MQG25572.1 50S ribosomal protein L32 [SAR202 cluster bacterium]CAI8276182.1 MAG: 50S ribosomal protein L32 [Chloroflexota bacterium]MCH2527967.1 50S ribosomal protein L32 [Dehalococcoidia bacterium]MQG52889.1 50S ribosomal protein L32 [SAR202 cluster bacterium]